MLRSRYARNSISTPPPQRRRRTIERLETRQLLSGLAIQFDYTYDTQHFFDTAEKKALLEQAASVYANRISDPLSAIVPTGTNTWTASFTDPSTGEERVLTNPVIPADTLVVYAGAHDLPGDNVGSGGAGGWHAMGNQQWLDLIGGRGQSGALGNSPTDFAPWGGSVTFDNAGTNWFFAPTTAGLTSSKTDFLSVAVHELGHLLGFGTAPSFQRLVVGGTFTGSHAEAAYDSGGPVPLAGDNSHWIAGATDNGYPTSMTPALANGQRALYTPLDYAALVDVGWTIAANSAPTLLTNSSPSLLPIVKNPPTNPGTPISSLLLSDGNPIFDADVGALRGIALVAVDTLQGQWEYSLDGGSQWLPVGSLNTANSRLLSDDINTRLRFVPHPDFHGNVPAGIAFRAWDRTSGTNGTLADTTANGGTTAFSSAIDTASITVTDRAEVRDRLTFYNGSAFDGKNLAAGPADDGAIATDKIALLPGGTAAFSNYTSFYHGLNGVMIDIGGLPGTPTLADFSFRTGNNNDPSSWTAAPPPTSLSIRVGAGKDGSDRITLIWADRAIRNTWLQVTVKATAATGLLAPDIFYFGNAIGESGNSPTNALVSAGDEIGARNDPHPFTNLAPIANTHDYSRDKFVNAQDQIIARSNGTTVQTALQLIRAPTAAAASSLAESLSGAPGGPIQKSALQVTSFTGIDSAPAAVALTQLRATAAVFGEVGSKIAALPSPRGLRPREGAHVAAVGDAFDSWKEEISEWII